MTREVGYIMPFYGRLPGSRFESEFDQYGIVVVPYAVADMFAHPAVVLRAVVAVSADRFTQFGRSQVGEEPVGRRTQTDVLQKFINPDI